MNKNPIREPSGESTAGWWLIPLYITAVGVLWHFLFLSRYPHPSGFALYFSGAPIARSSGEIVLRMVLYILSLLLGFYLLYRIRPTAKGRRIGAIIAYLCILFIGNWFYGFPRESPFLILYHAWDWLYAPYYWAQHALPDVHWLSYALRGFCEISVLLLCFEGKSRNSSAQNPDSGI